MALEWKPDLPKSTSTSTAMKKHYKQLLLAFEHKVSSGCPQDTVQASCTLAAVRGWNKLSIRHGGSCMGPTTAALQDTLWLPGSCHCLLTGTLHGWVACSQAKPNQTQQAVPPNAGGTCAEGGSQVRCP